MAKQQMLSGSDPVSQWSFVGKGVTAQLLQHAGFATMDDLYKADLDDVGDTGPVKRIMAVLKQFKQEQRVSETAAQRVGTHAYNAVVLATEAEVHDVPHCFRCPISRDWMNDPVITPSGITYDRVHLERWIRSVGTEPLTGTPLALTDLVPNRALHEAIDRYRQHEDFMTVLWE